ncbi:MAG: hypothetical protein R3D03_14320 [Geminicoccaceae bacterium]
MASARRQLLRPTIEPELPPAAISLISPETLGVLGFAARENHESLPLNAACMTCSMRCLSVSGHALIGTFGSLRSTPAFGGFTLTDTALEQGRHVGRIGTDVERGLAGLC